jgi:ribose transport system permease protein
MTVRHQPMLIAESHQTPSEDSAVDLGNKIPSIRWKQWLNPKNVSAFYVFVVLFAIFSFWIPDLFLTKTTWRTLLDNQVVTALCAMALVIPLAAGVVNLAVGAQVGAASILVGWLLVKQGMNPGLAVVICSVFGCAIGFMTGLLLVYARIDSFIGTLGVSSLLAAFITAISGGHQILGMPTGFADLGTNQLFGVTYPVYFVLIVAVALWYLLERTPAGRRIYATGGNIEAARLSGVSTAKVIIGSLVLCGLITSFAGMLVTARLANADPTIGPGYLLPSFTGAFLGSTQLKEGRFNIFGTLLAVYVLATGVKGLQLAGAPVWFPDAFNGAALLIAVALAKLQNGQGRTMAIARAIPGFLLRRKGVASTAVLAGRQADGQEP